MKILVMNPLNISRRSSSVEGRGEFNLNLMCHGDAHCGLPNSKNHVVAWTIGGDDQKCFLA